MARDTPDFSWTNDPAARKEEALQRRRDLEADLALAVAAGVASGGSGPKTARIAWLEKQIQDIDNAIPEYDRMIRDQGQQDATRDTYRNLPGRQGEVDAHGVRRTQDPQSSQPQGSDGDREPKKFSRLAPGQSNVENLGIPPSDPEEEKRQHREGQPWHKAYNAVRNFAAGAGKIGKQIADAFRPDEDKMR